MPLFPEREKVRGPAIGREPYIDDRLSLPCALAKEKMPAEWLLNSNLGLLRSSHMMNYNLALALLAAKMTTGAPKICKSHEKVQLFRDPSLIPIAAHPFITKTLDNVPHPMLGA